MARVDVDRGLTDLRRQLRKGDLALRNYNGDTIMQKKWGGGSYGTPEQKAAQDLLKQTGAVWRSLNEASKLKWNKYADKYGKRMGEQTYKDISGWDVYHPAYRNRALLGLPPAEVPGTEAPPPPVISIKEVPSSDERTFSFRITHSLAPQGYAVLARITTASITIARKPVERDLRMICGYKAESLQPLPKSGQPVTFTQAHTAIAAGERYGVEMRIVRIADGVHSKAVFVDLVRP